MKFVNRIQHFWKDLPQDPFNEGLRKSLAIHAALFLAILFSQLLPRNFFFGKNEVSVIKSSVRVDVVGMPKHTLQELKKMKLPKLTHKMSSAPLPKAKEMAPKKPEVVKPDELTFKKKGKSKKKDLSSILKNLSKKEIKVKKRKKIKKKTAKNSDIEQEGINKDIEKLIVEGNKLSKGASLVGGGDAEVDSEFSAYSLSLPDIVREYWTLPSYLMNQGLQARIRIFISKNGKVLKTEIYESSGNDEYDKQALRAIQKVGTFPGPPESIVHKLVSGQIVLGFPL